MIVVINTAFAILTLAMLAVVGPHGIHHDGFIGSGGGSFVSVSSLYSNRSLVPVGWFSSSLTMTIVHDDDAADDIATDFDAAINATIAFLPTTNNDTTTTMVQDDAAADDADVLPLFPAIFDLPYLTTNGTFILLSSATLTLVPTTSFDYVSAMSNAAAVFLPDPTTMMTIPHKHTDDAVVESIPPVTSFPANVSVYANADVIIVNMSVVPVIPNSWTMTFDDDATTALAWPPTTNPTNPTNLRDLLKLVVGALALYLVGRVLIAQINCLCMDIGAIFYPPRPNTNNRRRRGCRGMNTHRLRPHRHTVHLSRQHRYCRLKMGRPQRPRGRQANQYIGQVNFEAIGPVFEPTLKTILESPRESSNSSRRRRRVQWKSNLDEPASAPTGVSAPNILSVPQRTIRIRVDQDAIEEDRKSMQFLSNVERSCSSLAIDWVTYRNYVPTVRTVPSIDKCDEQTLQLRLPGFPVARFLENLEETDTTEDAVEEKQPAVAQVPETNDEPAAVQGQHDTEPELVQVVQDDVESEPNAEPAVVPVEDDGNDNVDVVESDPAVLPVEDDDDANGGVDAAELEQNASDDGLGRAWINDEQARVVRRSRRERRGVDIFCPC